jgi:photoactive yellow protein
MLAKTGIGVMPLENPDCHDPNLASIIERLPHEIVNSFPFGAIRLDPQGNVVFYSESERRLSGYKKNTITHSFFIEIAPCMDNANVRGRIDTALQAGKLNITFSHIGDFDDSTKELDVRVQSATDGGCWIFIRRG